MSALRPTSSRSSAPQLKNAAASYASPTVSTLKTLLSSPSSRTHTSKAQKIASTSAAVFWEPSVSIKPV